jgi:hypothetical protein
MSACACFSDAARCVIAHDRHVITTHLTDAGAGPGRKHRVPGQGGCQGREGHGVSRMFVQSGQTWCMGGSADARGEVLLCLHMKSVGDVRAGWRLGEGQGGAFFDRGAPACCQARGLCPQRDARQSWLVGGHVER